MKKKISVILLAIGLLFGFGAVAPVATAAPAEAYAVGTCHKRKAHDFYWNTPVEYTIERRNYSAWEEWTNPRANDGFYIVYKRQLVWPYLRGWTNEYAGYYFPTWGTFLRWC